MSRENRPNLTVVTKNRIETNQEINTNINNSDYKTNPIYQKLLNFRNLQEQQKKRFSVDDLFKLC